MACIRRPAANPGRQRYDELTYLEVLSRDLAVMDAAAISLSRENRLPIVVFNIHAPGAFAQVMRGEGGSPGSWSRLAAVGKRQGVAVATRPGYGTDDHATGV